MTSCRAPISCRASCRPRAAIRLDPLVSIDSTLRSINPRDWNRLAGENAFASHGWLRTVEACWRASSEALYFTLRRDGEILAAAVCYVVNPSPGVETLDDMLLGRLRPAASSLGISFLPALVCGPAQGYGWHIGINPRLDVGAEAQIRREMLDAIEAEADRRGLPLSLTQTLDDEPELRALLEERGYLRGRNVPIAWMDVPWRSIDDYFASLPAKSRREAKRECRRNIKSGTRIELLESCEGFEERFLDLLGENARRHGSLKFPFGNGFLSSLSENMADGALIRLSRKGEAVSGVHLALRHGETAVAYAVGVDAELGGGDFTYFRLGYYSLIEYAIQHRINRIFFGRGMYDLKRRRGCRLMTSWIYTRTSVTHRALSGPWYELASWWNGYKFASGG